MTSGALQRYNLVRFGITLAVLAWTLGIVIAGGWADRGQGPFFRACAVALTILVVTTAGIRRIAPSRTFILFQLGLDVVLASYLSYLTGGRYSFFIWLYGPAIAAGAYLLRMRGALLTATFATFGFLAMLWAHADFVTSSPEGGLVVFSETMFRIFAFFLIAILTGHLSELVERAGRQLSRERFTTAVLASEHGTVLDRVRAGVVTTDAKERITALNPFARKVLGDARGKGLGEVFAARRRDSWEEIRLGGERWICSEAALPDGGRVVVMDDVTELAHMRERAARDERLVAAGRLAASMAHEIRNPLASLSGSLQLLREDRPSRMIELALGEADRLNRLVEDFLGVASRPSMILQPLDAYAVAVEVCESFARDPRYGAKATVRCEGVPTFARADPDRLRQALWNLVLNGAQAMPRGGTVTVSVGEREDDTVEFRVSDEGVGIPPEERDHIFDPFYTTRSGGTGLGLALVEQVVRAHGGGIRVKAREPRGTEISFWIPGEARDAR